MLSEGLRQVLENLPNRIPLAVEVLDTSFSVIVPEAGYRWGLLVEISPETRRRLNEAVAEGRAHNFLHNGRRIDVYPIVAAGERKCRALLALAAAEKDASLIDSWGPVLRAAVQCDVSASLDVQQRLQQAKHLSAVLRFVRYLGEQASRTEILRAAIQAAAVWFDLDARIYRREGDDFVPYLSLPGASPEQQKRIPAAMVVSEAVHIVSIADLESLGLPPEGALLLPLGSRTADLLFVIAGTLPPQAGVTFGTIARVAGSLLHPPHDASRPAIGAQLLDALAEGSEAAVRRALKCLADACGASAGCVSVHRARGTAIIATVGEPPPVGVPAATSRIEVSRAAGRVALTIPVGSDGQVLVELVLGADQALPECIDEVLAEAREVLRPWGAGLAADDGLRQRILASPSESAAFLARLEEEIARAARFRHPLALVVIRGRTREVEEKLRAELRASDVLGQLGPLETGVLLIQTDSRGGAALVRRFEQRLSGSAPEPAAAVVGYAALSDECATAAALLARAAGAELSPRANMASGVV